MRYFFVSQRQTYKEEHSQGYLWAPRDDVWHHKTMSEVKKGDAIIQYTGEIVGIGVALKDCYDFDRPEGDGFQRWEKQGYKVEVEQFHFITPIKKESVKEALLESQPKNHAPLNVNGGVNQGYLFPANEAMVDIILRKALEIDQSPQQAEIVKKIQETLNIDLSKKGEDEPAQREDEMKKSDSIQKIFFGAPGTGKSFKVNDIIQDKLTFRTTFHPDYDYAQFVGAYKPKKVQNFDNGLLSKEQLAQKLSEAFPNNGDGEIDKTTAITLFGLQYAKSLKEKNMNEIVRLSEIGTDQYKSAYLSAAVKARLQLSDVDEKITYSFVPQVFAKAYATAWKLYLAAGNASTAENQVYLVIEEINRGNCAQIFGDIFQLLDRDGDGFSQYSIDADCDFAEWLRENGLGEGKLKLPPNLNILATMNTSDQSLFPMDSAFKRRFDWEYVPISFTDEDGNEKEAAKYEIDIPDVNGKNYLWKNFVETVNEKILELTESEDKQLGEFFIKPDNGNIISKERFLGKVMFYLWNEVCKDEHKNGSFFRAKNEGKEEYFTFQDLYKKKDLLKQFLDELLKKE
jgi:hypothetical protein